MQIAPNGAGVPTLSVIGTSSASFGYSSGSPVVTSTGDDPASALVWVVTCDNSTGANGLLQAFAAIPPSSGPWQAVYQAPLGLVAKFVQPATDNGRIFVGTRDGRVLGFGRPVTASITAPPTEFGLDAVGTPVTDNVTITAGSPVTVNGITTTGPYTVPSGQFSTPVTLQAGATITVPVTFTPTGTGSASGLLQVAATVGSSAQSYDFSLHGTGTQDGLASGPAQLSFASVGTTESAQQGITIQNTGTTATTITAITPPSAPFTVSGLPGVGATLGPQQSMTVSVLFSPTAATSYNDSLTIAGSTGSVTVPLTGTGVVGSATMTLTPAALDFGQLAPGASGAQTFTLANTGNAPLTISKAAPPSAPFSVATPIGEGQPISPGDSITVSIALTPTSAEPLADQYLITSDDGTGAHAVKVVANSSPPEGAVTSAVGCLDILSDGHTNGTPAVSYPCNATAAQQFALGAGGTIRVGPATSGMCLDVKGGATTAGTRVQLWACNGSAAQAWRWRADNSLENPHSALCLDIPGGSSKPNVALQLSKCDATAAQAWDLSALVAARGEASAGVGPLGQLCIDNRYARATPGNPVQLYPCNLSAAQILTHVANSLRIQGSCVAVAGAARANLSPIELDRCDASAAQVWVARADGSLLNPNSGKCLDDPGRSTQPGTRLELYTCNGTIAQLWRLPG